MVVAAHRFSLRRIANALEERPSSLAVDLVGVAAQLYAADRSNRRGRSWKRRLRVPVVVSEIEPWSRTRPFLENALTKLTDDEWQIDLSDGRQPLPEEQQPWLLKSKEYELTSVALFSGGLDSFAGAAAWLEEHPEEILGLVSISSSTVTGKVQRDLVEFLRLNFPNRIYHLAVPLKLIRAPNVERSQRTRGLVYTATATAIATCAGVQRVLIFENGYGAINPRLLEYQLGAQATKSTHPYVVHLLEDAYREAGLNCRIELPHVTETKAELLNRVPDRLRSGMRPSVSCDGFPLRIKDSKQCGHCGSCILRQKALRGAGLEAFDRDDYLSSPFRGGQQLRHLSLMAFQAKQLAELTNYDLTQVAASWPEVVLGLDGQLSLERIEWLQMLHRYGLEWQKIVEGDPVLASRLGWGARS
jgi:hypothetical protein